MLSRPLLKRNSKIVVFPVLSNHSYPMPQPARVNRLENHLPTKHPPSLTCFVGYNLFWKTAPRDRDHTPKRARVMRGVLPKARNSRVASGVPDHFLRYPPRQVI